MILSERMRLLTKEEPHRKKHLSGFNDKVAARGGLSKELMIKNQLNVRASGVTLAFQKGATAMSHETMDISLLSSPAQDADRSPTTTVVEDQRQTMHRSPSIERRLNEAARFYQALGESPPLSQSDLQKIIEDDNNSSDEEEEDLGEEQETLNARISVHEDDTFDEEVRDLRRSADRTGQNSLQMTSSRHVPISPTYPSFILPEKTVTPDFVYKGIESNPPEITKRGVNRGNYAQLHRKAWLEVSDVRHRYGKNLRVYYRHWESLGHPTNHFFEWLDSTGEAMGLPLPDLEECPRSQLDSETVLYIADSEVSKKYELFIVPDRDGKGQLVDVHGRIVCTGSDGWIFVLRDGGLYGSTKITHPVGNNKQRFHHSSFFGGKAVSAAGILKTDESGRLYQVYPHSGHYRPGETEMQRFLLFLHRQGVSLSTFEVDTQQLVHISRQDPKAGGSKQAKKLSVHLKPADVVAHFLSHKGCFIGQGILSRIESLAEP